VLAITVTVKPSLDRNESGQRQRRHLNLQPCESDSNQLRPDLLGL
jgi:hypothetical protein